MNKKFYLIPLFIIIFVFTAAFIVRGSYTNNGKKFYTYPYNSVYMQNEPKENLLKENGYSSYSDILKKSELIVKCTAQAGRTITVSAFYTPIKVLTVYKGSHALAGRQLILIENVTKQSNYNELNADFGYLPLYAGNEYVLCLTKKKWNRYKIPSAYEASEYYVTSVSAFGVFRTGNEKQTKLFPYPAKGTTIDNLKGNDIMTDGKNVLKQYYALKDLLFSTYKIR